MLSASQVINHDSYAAVQQLLRLGVLPPSGSVSAHMVLVLEATGHGNMDRCRELFTSMSSDDQKRLLAFYKAEGLRAQADALQGDALPPPAGTHAGPPPRTLPSESSGKPVPPPAAAPLSNGAAPAAAKPSGPNEPTAHAATKGAEGGYMTQRNIEQWSQAAAAAGPPPGDETPGPATRADPPGSPDFPGFAFGSPSSPGAPPAGWNSPQDEALRARHQQMLKAAAAHNDRAAGPAAGAGAARPRATPSIYNQLMGQQKRPADKVGSTE